MIKHVFATLLLSVGLSATALAQPVVSLKLSEKVVKPGVPVDMTFQVNQDGEPLTDFDVVHDKTSHLILVSSDYSDFQHVHPELDAKGTFSMEDVTFRRPGKYYVFMDVTPQGSKQIVKRFEVPVQGKAAPLVLKPDNAPKLAGDVRIDLQTMPARLQTGDAMLHFQLTRAGQPVTNIQRFMGAMGHVIAMGKDGAPFLHIHPMESGDGHDHANVKAAYSCPMHPEVTSDKPGANCSKCGMKLTKAEDQHVDSKPGEVVFHATFPAPGLYKVWGQFQVGDAMLIAPFTVKVD